MNGIIGGYTGAGFKTVIAVARLGQGVVPPGRRAGSGKGRVPRFHEFVRARVPGDCTVEFITYAGNPAISLPPDSATVVKARAALAEEWGRPPAIVGSGGSIPVVGDFKKILGMEFADGRLRARRRPHPFTEREIRPRELSQGHPLLGAHSRRSGRIK